MKTELRMILVIVLITVICIISGLKVIDNQVVKAMKSKTLEHNIELAVANVIIAEDVMERQVELVEENKRVEVFEGMTLEELAEKLERSMEYELDGYGYMFASHSINLGLDPYLALSVVLHETGCTWGCSYLARECNNFGGQKGSVDGASCGSYKYYPTRESGLIGFLDNLFYNYYEIGLTTPEAINRKYAESTAWSGKNKYVY